MEPENDLVASAGSPDRPFRRTPAVVAWAALGPALTLQEPWLQGRRQSRGWP